MNPTTRRRQNHPNSSILALDIGERRIGVAVATVAARLARPLKTLERGPAILETLQTLAAAEQAAMLVIGLPRSLEGRETAQTVAVEEFAEQVKRAVGLPMHWQDEAVTSRQAEAELQERGKPYTKADIDALSATYILEDFLREHPGVGR